LVDDDEAVISYLVIKLSKYFDIISTTQPEMVASMARREKPDVILCDIDMPDMSGGEVAAALAATPFTASIPLVYLTGLVSPAEARDLSGIISGRPGVSKRATVADLLQVIHSVLGDRRKPD
jgi:CheY-like chemotaxis protein